MRVALNLNGGVSERLKVTVLKTVEPERVPWVRIPPPPPATQKLIDYGELAESVEGARLLSEYTGQNLYRGFESLALRQKSPEWRVITRNSGLSLVKRRYGEILEKYKALRAEQEQDQ